MTDTITPISDRLELELRRIARDHDLIYGRARDYAAWVEQYYFADPAPADDRRPPRAPKSLAIYNAVKAERASRAH